MSAKLKAVLQKTDELELTVIGRRSRKEIPRPVWFVVRGDSVLLLPVNGKKTQWYRNLQRNPLVKLRVGSEAYPSKASLLTDEEEVRETLNLFVRKYGKDQMDRYYSAFDVAVKVDIV